MAECRSSDFSTNQGDRLDSPSPPDHVRVIRTLGNGRAATAELVEATWSDGRRKRYVEKVFAPGLLTRCIYRFAFASPFAYQANRHAILASFYRRRVAAGMIDAVAIRDGQPSRVDIALPAYVRYDRPRNAWVLAAEFVQGRGPVPDSIGRYPSGATNEMSDLIDQMKKVESRLIEFGLVGSGWQVSPGALVSTANLLIPDRPPLRVVWSESDAQAATSNELHFTIIDLESGIPAVLLWRYLWQSWKRGSLFPFDDLDPQRLRTFSQRISQQLSQRGESERVRRLTDDVERLLYHDQQWKTTEIAPFREPWTWVSAASAQRRSDYRIACIDRWQRQGMLDGEAVTVLQSNSWFFALLWMVGVCVPGSWGRWLQATLGSDQHRKQVRRFVFDRRCRLAFWKKYRNRKIAAWIKQGRCDHHSKPTSRLSFLAQRILGRLAPAGVHRYCVDSRRRVRRNRQAFAFMTRLRYQAAWGRRTFNATLRRWQSRRWISDAQAAEMRTRFNGPQLAVYSRGLGMHLAIKLCYPFMAPIKVGGLAIALAGGNLWWAILPLLLLPMMRTIVTVSSWLANRSQGIPHGHALCIGVLPTFGSAAFIVQMWTASPKVSTFLMQDLASRLAKKIPIYGGPDSRTEHAVIAMTDRLIRTIDYWKTLPLRFQNTMAQNKTAGLNHHSPGSSCAPRKWWPYPNVIRDSILLTATCCGVLWAIENTTSTDQPESWLTGENGALETTQLLVLFATVVFGVVAFFRTNVSRWRTIAIALACVALAGAAREIPAIESQQGASTANLQASELTFVASRYWKHTVIAIAGLVCLSRAGYAWFAFAQDRKFWFSPTFIWPAIPFASCFVLAKLFENAGWVIAEEGIEVFAYSMMLLTSVWIVRNTTTTDIAQLSDDDSTRRNRATSADGNFPTHHSDTSLWRKAG